MPRRARGLVPLAFLVASAGCGSNGSSPDDAAADAPTGDAERPDAAPLDSGRLDASLDGGARGDADADAAHADADTMQLGCEADLDLGTATGVDVVVDLLTGSDNELEPECAPPASLVSPERIFRWEAPYAATWTFDTFGSGFDTIVHVRTTECRLLGCSDDFLGDTVFSRVDVDLAAGEAVFVVVESWGASQGSFRLSITENVAAEGVCDDGVDGDRDGLIDCIDPDCQSLSACSESQCDDGQDNDGDGWVDCIDADCIGHAPCSEVDCDDGVDDDDDGLVDCEDGDCEAVEPCIETTCDDGIDEDMNGLTDCEDPSCACSLACLPADSCPDVDLGSSVGVAVALGTTEGCPRRTPDATECPGDLGLEAGTGPEATLLWTAPEAGEYIFDTSGSSYDTTLYLLDGCDGEMLVCNEDIDTVLVPRSRLAYTFQAGQAVVVVVDGWGGDYGSYVLTILAAASLSP